MNPTPNPSSSLPLLSRLRLGLLNEIFEWPRWWNELSFLQRYFSVFSILIYGLSLTLLQGLRSDHLWIGGILFVLSYGGRSSREFLRFALPFLLTAIVYDSQRFYADYLRGPIHVLEPYLFDRTFFGISHGGQVLTPNEWWQLHTHPFLDLITGFAYLIFFSVFILISAYFFFRLKKPEALRMPWAFFWLNVVGYSTYYWYAAAPPWYVAEYGFGPARLDTPASSAGCLRFDQFLGTHFFSEMYGRAADVFGAIPSLHVAYPLLAVYFAFRLKSLQNFCIFFYLLMCFSAVYLNHHYVLDILWGSFYAWMTGWIINLYYDRTVKG